MQCLPDFFIMRSLQDYVAVPLSQPLPLLGCADPGRPTVVYTFGYRGRATGRATRAVLAAYLAAGNRNVLLLDWEREAGGGPLGLALGYMLHALPNARMVGTKLGEALVQLHRAGLDVSQMHLVGHSLGAHVVGYAGRRARAAGLLVARITGLDPARVPFEGRVALRGLDRACAAFVAVVHSDAGKHGLARAAGSVDFWPNGGAAQPGCPKGRHPFFSIQDLCSHDRAWQYFAEAVADPAAFPAWPLRTPGRAPRAPPAPLFLGELTDTRARGSFVFTTGPRPPYGRGARNATQPGPPR